MSELIRNYELFRLQMIQAYHVGTCGIPDTLAYAMTYRMEPCRDIMYGIMIEHRDDIDPFEGAYRITTAEIEDVASYLDERWDSKESIGFSDLEMHFGGYRNKRLELTRITRYLRLHNLFDDEL